MKHFFLLAALLITGVGCATNCQNIQQNFDACQSTLKDQDFIIKKQESTIRQQETQIQAYEASIAELTRQLNISSDEKRTYDERIRKIASEVRGFMQKQMRDNREFLTGIVFDDFIGNELIPRETAGDNRVLIVEVANPVPSGGHIKGIGGYFLNSGEIVVKLLRRSEKDYMVIHSMPIRVEIQKPGKQFIDFDSPLIIKPGDIMAYYFPGPVIVPYDRDVGVVSFQEMPSDDYPSGSRVSEDDIWKENQANRKYSLNYYGIFYRKDGSEE